MKKLFDIALIFAASINCKNNGCLECRICKTTLALKYPNLYILEPVSNWIIVEEISELSYHLASCAVNEGHKIAIIKNAELMRVESANKCLKILEEPPDTRTIFILLTEDAGRIIPTIRSRCQIFNFIFDSPGDLGESDLKDLIEEIKIKVRQVFENKKDLSMIFGFSEYIKKTVESKRKELDKGLEKLKKNYLKSGFDEDDIAKNVLKIESRQKREKAKLINLIVQHVFDIITGYLEDIIILKAGAGRGLMNYGDFYDTAVKYFSNKNTQKLIKIADVIAENKSSLSLGINYELAIERILLEIAVL